MDDELKEFLKPGYNVEAVKEFMQIHNKETFPVSWWMEYSQKIIGELYGAPMVGNKMTSPSVNMQALRLLTFLQITGWHPEVCLLVLDKNNKELVRNILDMNAGELLLRKYGQ